jgi:hypothetical protein
LQWNPNPSENSNFDWWRAIKKAKIKSEQHLNDLISTFPPPDYRIVDLLAWKSQSLLGLGDRQAAKIAAEEAIAQARDSSWFARWDGAQLRNAFAALAEIDNGLSIRSARKKFGEDLSTGKLFSFYLLDEIVQIFAFLKIEWPTGAIRVIDDYLDGVLAANRNAPKFSSLTDSSTSESIDQAICRLVLRLVAFPVVDVGVAARRVLARYAVADGRGLVALMAGDATWDAIQFEHLLACVQVGLQAGCPGGNSLRALENYILDLNRHHSIAVRGIARRICIDRDGNGWRSAIWPHRRPC